MSGPGRVAGDQLRAFVERIEHVEEIRSLTEDKKEIFAEAKAEGFDVKNPQRGDPNSENRIRKSGRSTKAYLRCISTRSRKHR